MYSRIKLIPEISFKLSEEKINKTQKYTIMSFFKKVKKLKKYIFIQK